MDQAARQRRRDLGEPIVFGPTIAPQGSWSTWIEVVAAMDGTPTGHERTRYSPGDDSQSRAASRTELGTSAQAAQA
jgi:hypothetical protein